ncbi:DUF2927 domain-containing protein [Pontibacter sp. G13]|uniref:DUF2927 domain-containing protein n=1 Tax=Pontibacter sp. G13 TaxID=3074898 RepID=UPI002889D7B6|nr:DUF2927 domain-containing protein [Pontibacter sp. G13]WNJ20096.1 DUF2927 domain-containing protein [Pontibacter sp. G13]
MFRFTLLMSTFLFLLGSCKPDPVEPEPCIVFTGTPSQAESTFLDICFGNEFGEDHEYLRKWVDDIQIYLPNSHPELEETLDSVIITLNSLSESIQLHRVSDSAESNLILLIGSKLTYSDVYEPQAADLISDNFGLFSATWNRYTFEISHGTVCIDIERESDLACLRHLLREELTQVLGMMNDASPDPASIFHPIYQCTPSYRAEDLAMIQTFLSDELSAGMCRQAVWEAIQ